MSILHPITHCVRLENRIQCKFFGFVFVDCGATKSFLFIIKFHSMLPRLLGYCMHCYIKANTCVCLFWCVFSNFGKEKQNNKLFLFARFTSSLVSATFTLFTFAHDDWFSLIQPFLSEKVHFLRFIALLSARNTFCVWELFVCFIIVNFHPTRTCENSRFCLCTHIHRLIWTICVYSYMLNVWKSIRLLWENVCKKEVNEAKLAHV